MTDANPNPNVVEAARPYVNVGLRFHDACLAHGPAAERTCWRGLYGGFLSAQTVNNVPPLDDAVVALLTAPAAAQARILCAAAMLLDDDEPAEYALGAPVVLEGLWPSGQTQ